jgi:hypothetical protein
MYKSLFYKMGYSAALPGRNSEAVHVYKQCPFACSDAQLPQNVAYEKRNSSQESRLARQATGLKVAQDKAELLALATPFVGAERC